MTHAGALARTPVRVASGADDPFQPGVAALAAALPARRRGRYFAGVSYRALLHRGGAPVSPLPGRPSDLVMSAPACRPCGIGTEGICGMGVLVHWNVTRSSGRDPRGPRRVRRPGPDADRLSVGRFHSHTARKRLGGRGLAHRGPPGRPSHASAARLRRGNPANPGTADSLGSLIIRNLTPGSGYAWRDHTTGQTHSPASRCWRPAPTRRLTRRCTRASPCTKGSTTSRCATASSWPPQSAIPTARRARRTPLSDRHRVLGLQHGGTDRSRSRPCWPAALGAPCTTCGDSNLLPDSATDVGAVVARVSGFATVSLQMRGTGCSGGAFDLFGYPSDYDAYDAIEIVAHQAWVAHHKVGTGRHQLLGSVAVPGGRYRSARARRHHPHEPDRRPVLDRVSGRHLQQRLRRRVDRIPHRRRQAGGVLRAAARSPRSSTRPSPASASPGPTTRSTPSWRPATARRRPAWPTRRSTASRKS